MAGINVYAAICGFKPRMTIEGEVYVLRAVLTSMSITGLAHASIIGYDIELRASTKPGLRNMIGCWTKTFFNIFAG